ncbi:MAG: hypothetical protein J7639_01725 [Paenibacillaceae bacterium]|nr:hypothetical protein [Paenibacillaceae bacterium]
MHLNKDQMESLLAFAGYGDFSNAGVVFLMNEGGLGNRSVEENIDDICGPMREDANSWLKNDWRNGYWKIDQWSPGRVKKIPTSPFLRLSSRMVLALEDRHHSCEYWFQSKNNVLISAAKKFLMEGGLYSDRPGIRTALLDWRPLPRKTEDDPLPFENVDQNLFLKAFSFKDRGRNPYTEWRKKRIEVIRNLFESFPIPVVLCAGDPKTKKILVQQIWGISEYDEVVLSPSGKKIYVSKDKVGVETKIIVTPFLGYEHLGYSGTSDLTTFIKKYIKSLLP